MTPGGPDGAVPRSSTMDACSASARGEETTACPGCGLVLPAHAGPTHAYMGASPACLRLYGRASTLSWGQRDGLPLLRLVVDAYGAQHPGVRQIRAVQSVAVHLMGLCTILERGAHAEPRLIPVRDRQPAAARDTRPALARAAAPDRHADHPRTRRGGRRATSTPSASRRGRATCGRPGSPTTRPCATGSIARLRASSEARSQPAAAGASSSAWTLNAGQRERAERGDERDVDRVATAPDDDAADARRVVARVERVPAAVEVGLEPGREVHRLGGRRRLDVRDVAEHVAGRDVQRPAEGDGEVRVVAADALAGPVGVGGRRPRIGRARHPGQVVVDEVDDRLHPAPSPAPGARSAARPRGRARRAGRSGWASTKPMTSSGSDCDRAPPRRRARSRRPVRRGPARPRRRSARGRRRS